MARMAWMLAVVAGVCWACGAQDKVGDVHPVPDQSDASADAMALPDSRSNDTPDFVEVDAAPSHPYAGMEPSGVAVGDFLGIASHLPRDEGENFKREFELERLQEAGVTHLRKTFRWEHMEPEPDGYFFDDYNRVIDECAAHGIDVMVGFRGKPGWATEDGTHDTLDTQQWTEFLTVFVPEVAARVSRYEIWNEANLGVFWNPDPNPPKYGELLKAAFGAIHEHDDEAIVLLGGLSPFQFHEQGVWGFLEDLHAAHPDVCDFFDALSIHPYTFLQRLSPEDGFDAKVYFHPGVAGMVEEARTVLAGMGCPDKPIHLTEIGWPDLLITPESQAAYLARSVLLTLEAGAASWYWYTFWDGELTPATDIPTEERFGLFTWPNDETTADKEAYRVLKRFGNVLADYRYAGNLGTALGWPEDRFALVLRRDADWIIGLWRNVGEEELAESVSVSVPIHPAATGEWSLRDQNWQELASGSGESAVDVELSGRLTWLSFVASE